MKNQVSIKAIIVGIILIVSLSAISLIPTFCNTWNDENIWILLIIVLCISLVAFFIGGFVAGLIAKYRGNKHGFYAALITMIVSLIVNLIQGYIPSGILGIVIGVGIFGGVSALGGFIGERVVSRHIHAKDGILCPICHSDAIIRTVLKGKDKGKKFYVCSKYPQCVGRIKA
jgi:putative membrane protein (TIGR04086 family)